MKIKTTVAAGLVISALTTLAGTSAMSDAHADKAVLAAVKARQATMDLYAYNLGLLGAMAKGEVEYDAASATGAASNLAKLTSMDQSTLWMPGTDNETLGDATRALPAIWQEGSKAGEIAMELATASAAMEEMAGQGLDQLRAGMGPIGKACGACHDDYRQPSN